MSFDPTLAAIRFGVGLSPNIAPPSSVDAMMDRLRGPDQIGSRIEIPTSSAVYPSANDHRLASIALNEVRGTDGEAAAEEHRLTMRAAGREAVGTYLRAELARAAHTTDGFRERLARFWGDHFTVRASNAISRNLISPYVETVIRPHLAGNFANMLVAAVSSPMMILYLDQHRSMGPNSRAAQSNGLGLNENLAREILELHTLGVGGRYSQNDVREFAELLTGLTASARRGAYYRSQMAEPGSETVLGITYGGREESMAHVVEALRDLAVHPDTARHLARKLAVHFIAPEPDVTMIDEMAAAYLAADGGLTALYDVMLRSDAAWGPQLEKVKKPFDFISSAVRALGVPLEVIQGATLQQTRRLIQRPLSVMGQDWQSPVGPDGWPEEEDNWITPQGMAGRITWSMQAPRDMLQDLPDPRAFVFDALGPTPPDEVVFAAGAAETVSDGVGIVLASAAFQRR
ncbi:DUF1800 domain-containing protein [Octadecabacter sp. 1_MG-2023]|uniref:DUF1800 domain-containing protein n=1 Tax=unclassified Octadecabacter TaxID=196158 RepID=UPI001C08A03C|nr:DUF1800 domain-containing protein [Octadecabacter sp. 1_MG-2023]MBU2994655.1 DUF1800 domain-containing protein [Octadecabacter sp. B2R22]MDO6734052.1 DUF1800 domain-containing protein [Octadecabacter sp. 1_MG-2023]